MYFVMGYVARLADVVGCRANDAGRGPYVLMQPVER